MQNHWYGPLTWGLITAQLKETVIKRGEKRGELVSWGYYLYGGSWHKKKPVCLLSNQHQALKPCCFFLFSSMDGGHSEEETREGGVGRERRKRQRRVCDRVVMEGWGRGGSKSVWGGSLEERIRQGSATRGVSLTWPPCFSPSLSNSAHSHTHTHTNTNTPRHPIILTLGWSESPPTPKVSARKLWQMWWYCLRKIFPLSFSCSGSEETDRTNTEGEKNPDSVLITDSFSDHHQQGGGGGGGGPWWFNLWYRDITQSSDSPKTHHKM